MPEGLFRRKKIGLEKIALGILITVAVLSYALPGIAAELHYPTLPGGISLPEEPQLNEFVRYVYAFFIFVSGFIALGVLIFGGVLHLISGGNPVKKSYAREWMGAGFWGILVLFLSYIILATINPQLVGLKEVAFEPTSVPPYDVSSRTPLPEQKDIGFQIPMGKLIEQAIIDSEETKTKLSWVETKNDTELRQVIKENVQKTIDLINTLDPDLFELNALIDQCNCGDSVCSGDCAAQSCNLNCDLATIQDKASQIRNSPVLTDMEENEGKLAELFSEIKRRSLNLHKAVFLHTIFFDEVRDYFSFAIERETVAKIPDRKIETETLPEWQDIKLSIKTADGRVIPDPATFYFWKRYKEMEDAISFAGNALGSVAATSCPGAELPGDTTCVPSNPGAFVWPAQGDITLGYKATTPPYSPANPHEGIDIANNVGTPILAAADGKVIKIHTGCSTVVDKDGDGELLDEPEAGCGNGFGNHIVIEHKDFDPNVGTIYTTYAHLKDVLVNTEDSVSQGQQIGTMDTTGYVTGPHLHFQVSTYPGGSPSLDPMTYITGESICGPGGAGGGGKCEVITDPNNACYPDNLRPYFGARAEEASQICNAESGGDVWSLNDGCRQGAYDYSVGLFQINLYRTGRCDAVGIPESEIFEEISPSTCRVIDESKAKECARRYGWGNADLNIQKAVQIYNGRGNWCAWSTACPLYCNLCSDWSSCP